MNCVRPATCRYAMRRACAQVQGAMQSGIHASRVVRTHMRIFLVKYHTLSFVIHQMRTLGHFDRSFWSILVKTLHGDFLV